jgi:alanyl-tRNA synthetase
VKPGKPLSGPILEVIELSTAAVTERLYYHDSFLTEFDAQVISCGQDANRWRLILDRTAFYPTSGGQPHDTGTLGDAKVLEVLDEEDGNVVHFTDRAIPHGPIHGRIDWDRRFDHIQQHTGQHLLSAAFIELFRMRTVSFHLGREISTIDLAAPSLDQRQIESAERRTNEIIFDNRPVNTRFGTAEELAAAGIRKQVDRDGILRAIEIEGFDRQPCGGTHVSRTGQIGMILLRKLEKVKTNSRIEFVCGYRALHAARSDATLLNDAGRQLSCGPADVPAMVARALEERQSGHRARQRLTEELAEVQALMLLATEGRAGKPGKPGVVSRVLEEPDPSYLRLLATKIVAQPNVRAILGTQTGHVIFAQSAGLEGDMNALLRDCVSIAGGKGGGTRDFAQGSLPDPARVESVIARATEVLQQKS